MSVGGHDQFADQAAAYALGALSAQERATLEAHMATCSSCAAEVRAFESVTSSLAATAAEATPSPAVRSSLAERIASRSPALAAPEQPARVQSVAPRRPAAWPLALAASLVLAVGIGAYASQLRARVSTLEARLRDATIRADTNERLVADARRSAADAQSIVLVLAAPDLARIDLAGQSVAPRASARAFWSRSRGLVFTASNLPPPPPGRAYQLWVLTAQPAPISAGMLRPDANGRATARFDTPLDLPQPIAMAVTLEPEAGVVSPTGDKYLVGLAS